MKPPDPDAVPRRDGFLERQGTWAEVVVGSLLAGRNRTDVWEVLETSHGHQIEYGHTLWFRLANQKTGVLVAQPPRPKKSPVTFLTRTADESQPVYTHPSDTAAVMLLVEKLGARAIAARDNSTGEVTCPNYAAGHGDNPDESVRGGVLGIQEIYHLKICHGVDIRHLETLTGSDRIKAITKAHGEAHDLKTSMISGGFPHRHVPEDLSFL